MGNEFVLSSFVYLKCFQNIIKIYLMEKVGLFFYLLVQLSHSLFTPQIKC